MFELVFLLFTQRWLLWLLLKFSCCKNTSASAYFFQLKNIFTRELNIHSCSLCQSAKKTVSRLIPTFFKEWLLMAAGSLCDYITFELKWATSNCWHFSSQHKSFWFVSHSLLLSHSDDDDLLQVMCCVNLSQNFLQNIFTVERALWLLLLKCDRKDFASCSSGLIDMSVASDQCV